MSEMRAPRILILDDDEHYAQLFSAYLKLSGIKGGEVQHAASAKDVGERLRQFLPDLVFLDNRIPPYTDFRPGLKALRDAGYDGPVVVQSACVADEVFDEAPQLGVAEVIDKFDMNEVLLLKLLRKHSASTM
jgi:CheY-like chemotaxis protein